MTVRVPNPVLPGCYPDPSVCRVGDTYYLVTSTFEYLPGLPVLRSTDLVSWEQVGHVVHRPGQLGPGGLDYTGLASSSGLYAPTLRHHDGLFWLVCTLVDQQDDSRGGHVLLTAEDAAGPWSDPVHLEGVGIDPSLLIDDDGRAWFHATRLARDPQWHHQTEVWVRELDLTTRRLVGPEHVIWTGALHGAVWAEGPHLYRVGDGYLLVAAEGGTEHHHAVCVARADHVTGPYIGNRGNPVLTHRHLGHGGDVVGVGHADLVEAPDGTWWAVLLGMRPYGGYHYPLGRETFLVPVTWEDGWPVLARGVGRVPTEVEVPGDAWHPGAVQGAVAGPVPSDDLRWCAVRALPTDVATPRGTGWDLPLRPAAPAEVEVPAFLGLRLQHHDADLHVTLRTALADGEEVGLTVRQSERHHVRLAVTPDGRGGLRAAVRHQDGDAEHDLGQAALPGDPALPLTLVARVRGVDVDLLAGLGDADPVVVGRADLRTLDSVATGGFLGIWLGVHGASHGRPTTTVAHVDAVTYAPLPPAVSLPVPPALPLLVPPR
ncbi:family 43 glycosylhydrolase [Cellulomonas sp. NPDC058312]|uniref:glycoside hydrolase family 43 protein n=1 Tax=Cellulomonas sp. NPDC058312 TaxID=3346441 RepID=UPI0036EBE256